jgi:hypothetical protein
MESPGREQKKGTPVHKINFTLSLDRRIVGRPIVAAAAFQAAWAREEIR